MNMVAGLSNQVVGFEARFKELEKPPSLEQQEYKLAGSSSLERASAEKYPPPTYLRPVAALRKGVSDTPLDPNKPFPPEKAAYESLDPLKKQKTRQSRFCNLGGTTKPCKRCFSCRFFRYLRERDKRSLLVKTRYNIG